MNKEKLEELEGLKEDLRAKYEENFKLDNNSVIIILDEDEDAESTVEFVTIINLIINLGEKYNYTFIGISEFATTIAENLTLLKFTRARTL
ncbi:hypothetical protein KST09_13260 (plasmid) [Fusobacterium animalis]|uniref:hypothetical protein n=1 Tax=Fusobacterium animalis TaxID=76859 RepID=UPI0030CF5D5D